MLSLVVITKTDESLDSDEVRARLTTEGFPPPVLVSGQPGHWRSLLDWAVFVCRSNHKIDKKLVLELEDFSVVVKLLIQNSSRKLTGDADYLLSDMLEVQQSIRKWRCSRDSEPPGDKDGVVGEAVSSYPAFLKKCGLVDRWEIMKMCLSQLEGEEQTVILLGLDDGERDLVEMVGQVTPAVLSEGELQTGEKVPASELTCSGRLSEREKLPESVGVLSSFLRLLVSSKDELSLARAVTGSGLLTVSQFTGVRREAEQNQLQLPMFQTIQSFVRAVELGGKSYQPGENNQLHLLLPSLSQFILIMEKLQTRLEETPGPVAALTAVFTLLRSWLTKQGFTTDLDLLDTLQRLLEEVKDRQSGLEATPARGRMGRPAMKLLTGLLDLLGCLQLASNTEETGRTPVRQSRLVETFRTPQPETKLDPEDDVDNMVEERSLSERLAGEDVIRTPVTRASYPRFKSSNNFTEGSPAVLRSAERDSVVAGGATLRARAQHSQSTSPGVEETREILQEIRDKEKLEREAEVENIKQNIKKTKRSLAKEVDGIVREKLGMKRKKDGERTSPDRDKKPKKKKFSTPKGQRKLTSFFSKP